MSINVERLRVLVAVQRTGSLAAAAESLGVSPSAVSQQITNFERELEQELLIRSTRPATLTALGLELAQHGGKVLAELERAAVTVQGTQTRARGLFTIAALPSVAITMLTETLQRLADVAPELTVLVKDLDTIEAMQALSAQRIDMAIVDSHPFAPEPFPPDTTVVELGTEPLQILAAKSLFDGPADKPVGLDAFADQPWVLPSEVTAGGLAINQLIRGAGFEPDVRLETHDHLLLRTFVAGGLGVTLLPRLALADAPASCVVLDVADRRATRSLHALTRTSTGGSVAQRHVLEALGHIAANHLER